MNIHMGCGCSILGVMHTKDIAFVEPVRGDNCGQVSSRNGEHVRVVSYLSLEDWAGCCILSFLVSEWSHEQHHHHHWAVCSLGSWGRDGRVGRGYDETYAGSPESFRRLIFAVAAG